LSKSRWPDFFVVGAPKCGTTSMYEYLSQHPDVYFPAFKEPHFFGSDLVWRKRVIPRYQALDEYLNAPECARLGDASVFYLYSARAAEEIYARNQNARIVVMIRNPLSMIPSLFHQSIRTGDETHLRLTDAMDAEAQRRLGNIDVSLNNPGVMQQLYYSDVAKYSEQIERYIQVFGAEKVCVIEYSDFAHDPLTAVTQVASFLDLKPFLPTLEQHNKGRSVRSNNLWRFIKHPNPHLRGVWRTLLPSSFRRHVLTFADRLVFKARKSLEITPEEQRRIADLYAGDVSILEKLIGLDLSHWHADFKAATDSSASVE